MVVQGYDDRKNFWLEVENGWRGWIETPNRGAESSPTGRSTDGTLVNGGGYVSNSVGSHMRYTYEWRDSSSLYAAQFMKSLRDGTYGRGLIHFIEPTKYDKNVAPARLADPSMAVGNEGASLVYGVSPTAVPTTGNGGLMLPFNSAYYPLRLVTAGYRGDDDSIYLSVPEGFTLLLGAFYQSTGTGGVFARTIDLSGNVGTDIRLTELSTNSDTVIGNEFSDIRGVRIWVGKTDTGNSSVTFSAFMARLVPTDSIVLPGSGYGDGPYGETPYGGYSEYYLRLMQGPWVGGMGNSGVQFLGTPTFINNTGIDGGTAGFAASFIEVGDSVSG